MLGFLGLDRELGLGLHHSARKSAVPADLLASFATLTLTLGLTLETLTLTLS